MDTTIVKNKWTSGVRWMTLVVSLLVFGGIAVAALSTAGSWHGFNVLTCVIVPVLLAGVLAAALLWWPIGVAVGHDRLKLVRLWRPVVIDRANITDCRKLNREDMWRTIRICGSGGYLGYWGLFRNPQIGTFTMHTLGGRDLLLIECRSGKKYVIENSEPVRNFLNSEAGA